jgi:hypothetical protein
MRTVLVALLLALGLALAPGPATRLVAAQDASGLTLSLTPSTTKVKTGDIVTFTVRWQQDALRSRRRRRRLGRGDRVHRRSRRPGTDERPGDRDGFFQRYRVGHNGDPPTQDRRSAPWQIVCACWPPPEQRLTISAGSSRRPRSFANRPNHESGCDLSPGRGGAWWAAGQALSASNSASNAATGTGRWRMGTPSCSPSAAKLVGCHGGKKGKIDLVRRVMWPRLVGSLDNYRKIGSHSVVPPTRKPDASSGQDKTRRATWAQPGSPLAPPTTMATKSAAGIITSEEWLVYGCVQKNPTRSIIVVRCHVVTPYRHGLMASSTHTHPLRSREQGR